MKRLTCIIMALVMILSFPASAFADEPLTYEVHDLKFESKDDIRELALIVFPEYANEIRKGTNELTASTMSVHGSNTPTLEVSETRMVSDNLSLTYYQYSNGVDLLALTETSVVVDDTWTNNGSTVGTTGTTYNVDITLDCNVSEALILIGGISYKIVSNDYDLIVNAGTILGDVAGDSYGYITSRALNETSSRKAYVEYSLIFDVSGIYEVIGDSDYINVTAILRVGSNQAYMDIYSTPNSI